MATLALIIAVIALLVGIGAIGFAYEAEMKRRKNPPAAPPDMTLVASLSHVAAAEQRLAQQLREWVAAYLDEHYSPDETLAGTYATKAEVEASKREPQWFTDKLNALQASVASASVTTEIPKIPEWERKISRLVSAMKTMTEHLKLISSLHGEARLRIESDLQELMDKGRQERAAIVATHKRAEEDLREAEKSYRKLVKEFQPKEAEEDEIAAHVASLKLGTDFTAMGRAAEAFKTSFKADQLEEDASILASKKMVEECLTRLERTRKAREEFERDCQPTRAEEVRIQELRKELAAYEKLGPSLSAIERALKDMSMSPSLPAPPRKSAPPSAPLSAFANEDEVEDDDGPKSQTPGLQTLVAFASSSPPPFPTINCRHCGRTQPTGNPFCAGCGRELF